MKKQHRHRVRRQFKLMKDTAQLFMVDQVLVDLPHEIRRHLTLSVFRRAATTYLALPHSLPACMSPSLTHCAGGQPDSNEWTLYLP